MKLSKLLIISVLCACGSFVLTTVEGAEPGSTSSDHVPEDSSSHSLFGLLLKPIRATIEQARRFLDNRIENVYEGVDMVQLQTFQMFMNLYNKTYSPEELPRRMALFFNRRKEIEESIKAFAEGRLPFVMRENAFIDWDEDELKALAGVSPPRSLSELTPEERRLISAGNQSEPDVVPMVSSGAPGYGGLWDDSRMSVRAERVPASFDWRSTGCVAQPINQQRCGACYAIATIGVLESIRCINQISSPILSPQQVIDCSTPRAGYRNYGCNGGWPTRVLRYLQDQKQISRETCYPFVKRQNSCKLRTMQSTQGCTLSSSPSNTRLEFKVLNNERDILYHVAKTGPVVTVMKATDKFLYYGSGIFDDPSCSNRRDDVDHAIAIVGYGRENNIDYWLIKNSWGVSSWGEDGYAKYRRGKNACSIGHWGWVITS